MKIVIDIPEEIYKASQIIDKYGGKIEMPIEVIKNGKPIEENKKEEIPYEEYSKWDKFTSLESEEEE